MGELDNISENAFVAPDVSNENSAFSENNLNQDIIAALQDDLVTSTTEVTSTRFIQPEPEIVEPEPEVTEERPFRRFRLRRPPGARNSFRSVFDI